MQKYIKKDLSDVRYFEDDVNIDDWIDLNEFRLMTSDEIDRHENPQKYWTDDQRVVYERSLLAPLTKRQFNFHLKSIGRLDEVRILLASDEDAQLEYESVSEIHRNSPTVSAMGQTLGLTEEQIDEMWKAAQMI